MEDCGEKILVVDDDQGCRTLIYELLESAGLPAARAATGEEALAMIRRAAPRLAILDVRLPGVSGYEMCHRLKLERGNAFPVVLVSGERTESFDRVAGFLIGADEYVSKPFAPDELLARVRRLLPKDGGPPRHDDADLTRRELEVLRLLAGGLRQAEIARRLTISPRTVASHIEQILSKLEVHSRAEAVAAAFNRGLVTGEPALLPD